MTRKLKTIGVALVAVFALSAVVASAASAANFTAAEYPVTLKGEQPAGAPHIFAIGSAEVECEEAKFTGTGAAASSTQTINASYSGCEAFGFLGSTVTMNGCDYLFHLANGSSTDGTVDIVCPTGQSITIYAGGESSPICTAHIGAQNGLSTITFANNSPHVDVTAEVKNIATTVTRNSILCPLAAGAAVGTYNGKVTLKGTNSGGAADKIDIG